MAKFAVVLAAAGKSSRFRDKHYKKPFAPLKDRAVWLHCADKFLNRDDVVQVLIVIAPEDRERFMDSFGANVAILGIDVVEGGAERSDSIANALERVNDEVDYVAVHDAARPCLANEWIDSVFLKAATTGAAMLAIPITGTVKRVGEKGVIQETVPRDNLWEAQTPQVFRKGILLKAYAQRGNQPATDDAELVQRSGQPVTVVTGSPINLKITTKEDLRLAANALNALPKPKLPGATHPFADDDLWR
ncbi:MAG: 2-C-methyl-D-erythritol 4-phosphate cytidylyltransferase [Pirellulaceae bacterium]|jgi:2-C-methyl-D-erythritol 4-phosphate cytidylyltransferase|nr:2-C-methyl-D-erythritol 4-phosphate cytidylyltransferase [Pirellulaceae bacterium]MDP6556450.1 2-C-methyl-D-erythritol 4-phosphate cytidylyltransferase [Pirellulaceae bacterium]MDP6719446.1 2-C-methyl-D-erythritol 4-phosphate cytidylyltransferase [Pirellulaceae bacterium]